MKIFSSLASLDQIRGSPLSPMLRGIVHDEAIGELHPDPCLEARSHHLLQFLGARHPAATAASSEQNHRSPFEASIRVAA